jgi:hypothetical protein
MTLVPQYYLPNIEAQQGSSRLRLSAGLKAGSMGRAARCFGRHQNGSPRHTSRRGLPDCTMFETLQGRGNWRPDVPVRVDSAMFSIDRAENGRLDRELVDRESDVAGALIFLNCWVFHSYLRYRGRSRGVRRHRSPGGVASRCERRYRRLDPTGPATIWDSYAVSVNSSRPPTSMKHSSGHLAAASSP